MKFDKFRIESIDNAFTVIYYYLSNILVPLNSIVRIDDSTQKKNAIPGRDLNKDWQQKEYQKTESILKF